MKTKFPECRLPRVRDRRGRCYELAYKGVMRAPSWTLVHGWLDYGPAIGHAWLEKDGEIYCPTSDAVFLRADYHAQHRASAIATYTHLQAAVCACKSGHYGPWERSDELLIGVDFKKG